MSDEQMRAVQRRRLADGEPAFKPGDVVSVHLWHGVCWPHSMGYSNGFVATVEAFPERGRISGGDGSCGVRLDDTHYNKVERAKIDCVFKNEFCAHWEHWTLLRAA